ncbi:MAG TPA: tryptophan synthase subunit alpha [Wenzhouxiangella sp.]|nr:tryptophan synthase subunit alpha [Wenzhouxiangella sp.]
MNRIDARFEQLRQQGRKGLIPYVTAGYPEPAATVPVMHAAVAAGADLIEVGMPFSDVMADGPVIQQACASALEQGTGTDEVLAMVAEFRRRDQNTPVIFMGYANLIERRGAETFCRQAADAGADGLLIADCPVDESEQMQALLAAAGLHQIFLAAPTTTASRLELTASRAAGFLYYISVKGVTGAATLDTAALGSEVERVRAAIDLPVAVGFGIRTAQQAAAVAACADAVIIGSALVRRLGEAGTTEQAVRATTEYLEPIRRALDESVAGQNKAVSI